MTMKTMFPNEIMQDPDNTSIEKVIVKLIDDALKEKMIELAAEDIKIIAKDLMPNLDLMVSKKVKEHLYEIGLFMVDKFGDTGE
jgi:hypothetical protein